MPKPVPDRDRARSLMLSVRAYQPERLTFCPAPGGGLQLIGEGEPEPAESVTYELRPPTVAARGRIMAAAMIALDGDTVRLDVGKLQTLALLECVYFGGEKLFAPEDAAALGETVVGTHLDVLAKRAQALVNLDGTAVGKG